MARDGADPESIAAVVMRGVEREIRMDGGAPAFKIAVDLIILICEGGQSHERQLFNGTDSMRRDLADSPLTRDIARAAECIGLSAITDRHKIFRQEAAEKLLAWIGDSRCCSGMPGYLTRNRTRDPAGSQSIVSSVSAQLAHTAGVSDLATRMLNGSANGLPAKAAKIPKVRHSAEALNDEEL